MIFKCKLAAECLDCPNAYMDVHNELMKPSGEIIPTTIKSTLYCRHMNVCQKYLDSEEGDQMVLVPLSSFLTDRNFFTGEESNSEMPEGDGINE